MTPKVSIIVTVLNALKLTKKAVDSVVSVDYPNKQIIVVDNNSETKVKKYLRQQEKKNRIDLLIQNDKNVGFGRACNAAANVATGDYLCFFSNDIEAIDNNWLKVLVEMAIENPNAALIGCRLLYRLDHQNPKIRNTIQHAGCSVQLGKYLDQSGHVTNKHLHRYKDSNDPEVLEKKKVEMVTAACFLVSKQVFFELGGFDPIFGLGYCEDLDLNLKARKAGYEIWYCPDAALYHFEMVATKTTIGGSVYRKQRTANQQIISQRWTEFVANGKHKYV